MIQSEILEEKYRVQAKLSSESTSIHDYFCRSHIAAKAIAASYGICLQYAEVSERKILRPANSDDKSSSLLDK